MKTSLVDRVAKILRENEQEVSEAYDQDRFWRTKLMEGVIIKVGQLLEAEIISQLDQPTRDCLQLLLRFQSAIKQYPDDAGSVLGGRVMIEFTYFWLRRVALEEKMF